MLGSYLYGVTMNKREIIDEIMRINHSAKPEFLARFKENHLGEYLRHLNAVIAEQRLHASTFAAPPGSATVERSAAASEIGYLPPHTIGA